MKRRTSLSSWPNYLHPIFLEIGQAMDGRQLHPNMLEHLSGVVFHVSDQHSAVVKHLSGERAMPGGNRYEITIKGPRIDGKWHFRSGELADLARQAVSEQALRQKEANGAS